MIVYADMQLQRTLRRLFGSMWLVFRRKNGPLDERCYCCEAPALRRCLVNTWGTICCYDLCREHADRYRGKNVDEVGRRVAA